MTTGALPLLLLEKVSPKRSASISLKSEWRAVPPGRCRGSLVDAKAASEVGVGDVSATNGGALAKGSSWGGLDGTCACELRLELTGETPPTVRLCNSSTSNRGLALTSVPPTGAPFGIATACTASLQAVLAGVAITGLATGRGLVANLTELCGVGGADGNELKAAPAALLSPKSIFVFADGRDENSSKAPLIGLPDGGGKLSKPAFSALVCVALPVKFWAA